MQGAHCANQGWTCTSAGVARLLGSGFRSLSSKSFVGSTVSFIAIRSDEGRHTQGWSRDRIPGGDVAHIAGDESDVLRTGAGWFVPWRVLTERCGCSVRLLHDAQKLCNSLPTSMVYRMTPQPQISIGSA